MGFFTGTRVLVPGGTGLIGQPLIRRLLAEGALVRIASLDNPGRAPANVPFTRVDFRSFDACLAVMEGVDTVFNLVGIKGSPAMTQRRPASFFVPTLMCSINLMEAARRQGVKRFLFTSSIGVYEPADVFREDDVWSTFPSPNDRFAGWAKRMGELQAEAYAIEHGWKGVSIVRPANVYGPFDNFDPENAMVIPSLIHRVVGGENPLVVWGDGSPVRDFIHADDVARGMMAVMEAGETRPVNLGSGTGVAIRDLVRTLADCVGGQLEIRWDASKPAGDALRLMDVARAQSLGFKPQVDLRTGIAETLAWYRAHREAAARRYNAFTDDAHRPTAAAPNNGG